MTNLAVFSHISIKTVIAGLDPAIQGRLAPP
jgi:hypothetical protein